MTLIIASCNALSAVISADTRLSNNRVLVDDASAKIGSLFFYDGSLLYAYTGIARFGRFRTRNWLLELFAKHVAPWMSANDALLVAKEQATKDSRELRVLKEASPADRRLTVVFVGYLVHAEHKQPVAAVLSNFENYATGERFTKAQDQFWLSCWLAGPEQRSWIGCFGCVNVVSSEDQRELWSLTECGFPGEVLREKAQAIIVRASIDSRSSAYVGSNILRALLSPDDMRMPTVGYSSASGGNRMLLIDQYDAVSSLMVAEGAIDAPQAVGKRALVRRRAKQLRP